MDKNLYSNRKGFKIEYGESTEIAMGGPLEAACFLVINDSKKIKLSDWAGGPAVWNTAGHQVAFPIWTNDRNQKIRLVNIDTNEVLTFSRKYRVVHLEQFEDGIITGIDSPIYKSWNIQFNIKNESIESLIKIDL